MLYKKNKSKLNINLFESETRYVCIDILFLVKNLNLTKLFKACKQSKDKRYTRKMYAFGQVKDKTKTKIRY